MLQLFQVPTVKDSLRKHFGETVIGTNGKMEITRVAVTSDGWAYGELSLRSGMVRLLGQERIVGTDKLEVDNGKITPFYFSPDILDTQTRDYYTAMGAFGGHSPKTPA